VLTDLVPLRREIETPDNRWYNRRTLPYRTHDNRIEGVVITFADISEVGAAGRCRAGLFRQHHQYRPATAGGVRRRSAHYLRKRRLLSHLRACARAGGR